MTLTVTGAVYAEMIAHARADHPIEACGVLIGIGARSDYADRAIAMVNVEQSATCFRFEAAAQLAVWQDAEDQGEQVIAVYHSHTATEAYPSGTDIAYAADPDVRYVVISTADGDELRVFRIVDGTITEEDWTIDEP